MNREFGMPEWPALRSLDEVYVDILVLLLAHRKPLPFFELFYIHSIVHLKLACGW